MAISDNYLPIVTTGNGVTTEFSGSWDIISVSYLVVELFEIATGDITTQVLDSDYTLIFDDTGFMVTMMVAPTSGFKLVRYRRTPLDQSKPFSTSRGWQGGDVENSLDKLTAMVQDAADGVRRSFKVPVTSNITELTLPEPVDDTILAWSGTSGAIKNGPTTAAFTAATSQAAESAADALASEEAALVSQVAAAASAVQAAASALAAAASQASINLPTISAGAAGKTIIVNAGGTGYDLTSATLAAQITAAIAANNGVLYPIGSTYINKTDATNPATLFGFGTWVAETDKFIVSHGSTFTTNGGATTVTLAANQIPALTGQLNATNGNGTLGCVQATGGGSGSSRLSQDGGVSDPKIVVSIPNASQQSVSIIPSYQAYYIWTRTA